MESEKSKNIKNLNVYVQGKKSKESGPPSNRPEGTSSSVRRATFKTSSNISATRTMAKPGPSRLPSTKAEDKAVPISTATVQSLATKTNPKTPSQRLNAAEVKEGEGPAKVTIMIDASGRKWPIVRWSDPAKAGHQEKRTAARILRLVHAEAPTESELTTELKESINWAKAVIPDFRADFQKTTAPKRQRSVEEQKPSAKRVKMHNVAPKKSFADVVKNRIIIGVIDEGNSEGKIPRAQWKWVQVALTKVVLEVMAGNPGPPPSCEDAGWYQGQIKIIACDNERSVELYKAAISKVGEVYPGAILAVVDKEHIPSRPRARAWIPSEPQDPAQIMAIFKACNPELPIGDWKLVKVEDDNVPSTSTAAKRATMQVLLLLNKESLEPLAKSDGQVRYGFGKVKVKIYRADTEAVDFIAATAEPDESDNDTERASVIASEDGYLSSGSELAAVKTLFEEETHSERELLGEDTDSQEDVDMTIVENASYPNKPSPL